MKIRPYRPEDRPRLLELNLKHARAQDAIYLVPDPEDRLSVVTLVLEDDAGIPVAFLTGRLEVEAILTLDPEWETPEKRWSALKQLFHDGCVAVYDRGLREVHAGVHPHNKRFGGRLQKELGFVSDNRERLILDLEDALGGA